MSNLQTELQKFFHTIGTRIQWAIDNNTAIGADILNCTNLSKIQKLLPTGEFHHKKYENFMLEVFIGLNSAMKLLVTFPDANGFEFEFESGRDVVHGIPKTQRLLGGREHNPGDVVFKSAILINKIITVRHGDGTHFEFWNVMDSGEKSVVAFSSRN